MFSSDKNRADLYLYAIIGFMRSIGLVIHEIEPAQLDATFVDLEFRHGVVSIKHSRLLRG